MINADDLSELGDAAVVPPALLDTRRRSEGEAGGAAGGRP